MKILAGSCARLHALLAQRDPFLLVLGGLLGVVFLLKGAWAYNPEGGIDPWLYTGFFRELRVFQSRLFPGTYYGSRLPWILPGWAAYALCGPLQGHWLLHGTFLAVAILSLYLTLKHTCGPRGGFLASMALSAYPWFLFAEGWDYVDGAVISYYLLGMACLTLAAEPRRRWILLLAAGAAGAATFYCQALSIVLLPTYLMYCVHTLWQVSRGHFRRECTGGIFWLVMGALLLTLLLGAINVRLGGDFWFYGPSLSFGLNYGAAPNPWYHSPALWIGRAGWLILHIVGCLAALGVILIPNQPALARLPSLPRFFAWNYLGCLLLFVGLEFQGRPDLECCEHASFLIPILFLSLGACLAEGLEDLSPRAFRLLATVFMAMVFLPLLGVPVFQLMLVIGRGPILGMLSLLAVVLFLCVRVSQRWVPVLRWGCLVLVLHLSGNWTWNLYAVLAQPNRDGFRCVQQGFDFLQSVARHKPVRFWYKPDEGHLGSDLAAMYLWGYSMVNREFPSLDAVGGKGPLDAGQVLVIVSGQSDAHELAARSLQDKGFAARLLGKQDIRIGQAWLPLMVVRLEKPVPMDRGSHPGSEPP